MACLLPSRSPVLMERSRRRRRRSARQVRRPSRHHALVSPRRRRSPTRTCGTIKPSVGEVDAKPASARPLAVVIDRRSSGPRAGTDSAALRRSLASSAQAFEIFAETASAQTYDIADRPQAPRFRYLLISRTPECVGTSLAEPKIAGYDHAARARQPRAALRRSASVVHRCPTTPRRFSLDGWSSPRGAAPRIQVRAMRPAPERRL